MVVVLFGHLSASELPPSSVSESPLNVNGLPLSGVRIVRPALTR